MDVRQRILNEMAILSEVKQTNSVPYLQELLGYQPLMIHNAITQGLEDGTVASFKRKNGAIEFTDKTRQPVTKNNEMMGDEIEYFVREANAREWDITIDELQLQLLTPVDTHIRIAIYANPKLTTYELADPKQKKSVYTFVTLTDNKDKQFGKKQFKGSK